MAQLLISHAARARRSADTLRFYERKGVLLPRRSAAGY
jgi:DNA-binding transcriptional MerR regulator